MAAQQRTYNTGYQARSHNNGHNSGGTNYSITPTYRNNTWVGNQDNGTKFGNQDRRQPFFCEFCKILEHTIQKCFKIHGYPLGHRLYKGKRIAATVQSKVSSGYNVNQTQEHTFSADPSAQGSTAPVFTQEQYQQLLSLLKHHSSN